MTESDFDYPTTVPRILTAMSRVNATIESHDLAPGLRHLVELRASQINRCAFCVKMHVRDARREGETDERLDRLVVWRDVDDFSPAEKAAFAWTEALTSLAGDSDLAPLRDALTQYYSAEQIGTLTAIVAMINLWNRIQRSTH